YGDVEIRLLTDRDATREAILDGLEWLEKQVTSRDVGMLFLAGHGINDERQTFWFLPADASPERLRQRAVSHDDIRRTLQALAGKAIL
ncbi:caspase family protein, partial [Mycobacterium tuberculosis]|nr:caspase family protein [Mycobacterium tuberculosis]